MVDHVCEPISSTGLASSRLRRAPQDGVKTSLTSERSTGEQVRRGGITKAGNPRARRVLIEGAWTYRYPARLSRPLQVRQESLPKIVRAIAWKAQVRLCARYRRLMAAGKRQTLITTAIAREMAAFLWAIGHEVQPRSAA
jgi:hypothetical protein